jgi:hypothetical protein
MPNPKKQRVCDFCKGTFVFQNSKVRKFCSPECRRKGSAFPSKEEMAKRGMLNPTTQRKRRFAQIELEESIANSLREDGWEVFSPTVVCDRIGIKDGEVFFLEFKPEGSRSLRPGQKRVHDCASAMYRVITHPK